MSSNPAAAPPATTGKLMAPAAIAIVDKQAQQQQQQTDNTRAVWTQHQEREQSSSRHQLATQQKTFHSLLAIPAQMELSQIELIYRAEGNANLVLALPQFKKVLRLPKMLPKSDSATGKQQTTKQKPIQQSHYKQQQVEELEQRNTSGTVVHQNTRAVTATVAADLTMEDFAAYIDIIRLLLGNIFVSEVDVVRIPSETDRKWINEHINSARPAHRRDKEFCGQFGLLLPDAAQLPTAFDTSLTSLQANVEAILTGDTYAVEIKPKQGWLLPTDVNDLFDTIKPTAATERISESDFEPATAAALVYAKATAAFSTSCSSTFAAANLATKPTAATTSLTTTTQQKVAKTDIRCRYCAMQYLKLQHHKIARLGSYCPIELFSGTPARMLAAVHALLECPQNNLRVFRNGHLIYGDHVESISWQQLKDTVFKGDKLQLIKHLLVTCLLKDYDTVAVADQTPPSASVSTATANVGELAVDEAVVKAVTGQPHSSATPPSTEQTEIQAAKAAQAPQTQAQINEAEMRCLPKNCVLQKILHLQLLVKRNLRHLWHMGYACKRDKSYEALHALLAKGKEKVNFSSLHPVEEYLLGATALDCSVMIAFREVSCPGRLPPHPQLVEVPAYGKCYLTKVTLLDLDPKPDSHYSKYIAQTKETEACQRQS